MTAAPDPARPPRGLPDAVFYLSFAVLGGTYVVLIVAMLAADLHWVIFKSTPGDPWEAPVTMWNALSTPEIGYSTLLSLTSCFATTILCLWVAVPLGYLLSRARFRGKAIVDAVVSMIVDIPIVLPPLVVGLSLLILFQTSLGRGVQSIFPVTYAIPSVILAQFSVSAAFAVRTMRATFDQISPRTEQVALTLGCSRSQAFWRVTYPEARRGLLTAATLSWARSLGEFGPILIFSGATRFKTEVLPTTVFLELSIGRLEAAIAVSLLMIAAAVVVLVITRIFGLRGSGLV